METAHFVIGRSRVQLSPSAPNFSDSESIADACDTLILFIYKFCVIEMLECLRIACMSLSSTPGVCGLVAMPRRKACPPCHKGRELSRSKTWPSGLCSSSCFLQITHGESAGMITRRQLLLQEKRGECDGSGQTDSHPDGRASTFAALAPLLIRRCLDYTVRIASRGKAARYKRSSKVSSRSPWCKA